MSALFNYISFSSSKYVEENNSVVEMDKTRMFEYTPDSIATKLRNFDEESKKFLVSLPTFLCSEISREHSGEFIYIKLIEIEQIHVDETEVVARFSVKIDFGNVKINDYQDLMTVFGLSHRFQFYRTHWAVGQGDAASILRRISRLAPQRESNIEHYLAGNQVSYSQPPMREDDSVGEASSVESFLKLYKTIDVEEDRSMFFRGHSNDRFMLTPSLLRKNGDGSWIYLPNEDKMCKELLIAHHDEFFGDFFCFDRLVRMQHYGIPTRLLDITSNPLVALFFACYCANIDDKSDDKSLGEVIVFKIPNNRVKYYDSDSVSCISNLSNLTFEQKNKLILNVDVSEFNEKDVVRQLLHYIRREKGGFESKIDPRTLGSILCVKAKLNNARIRSQSGAFLLYGHEAVLPENGDGDIYVRRIKVNNKKEILGELDRINISATTVYPGIEQTSVQIKLMHEIRSSV